MPGLFDIEYQLRKIKSKNPPLQRLNALIDWEMFRHSLDEAIPDKTGAQGGRPPYDNVLMFKVIILQRYYNLSDEQTELQIRDRLSFLDFLGLQVGDNVPDEKTIWVFKEKLRAANLSDTLFEHFTGKLMDQGIIAREGSMVDASFVEVPRQRNSREENADIKQDATPLSFGKQGKHGKRHTLCQKDRDARWMTKNGERHYGYKNHVNADENTKLITKFTTTSAAPHDSTEFENLIDETDNRVHADSAYRSEEIERYLQSIQCESQIHERAYRNKPLSEEQKKTNTYKSKTRAKVEHIFGDMTYVMHQGLNLRVIGKERIHCLVGLLNLTYNLIRYEILVRYGKVVRI